MKAKVNGKTHKEHTNTEISKVDAIKEILFGENMQNYDKEFDRVKKDILSKKNELLHLISETEKELHSTIDTISTDVNIRITALEDRLGDHVNTLDENKLDKALLGNLLIKLGEKISN